MACREQRVFPISGIEAYFRPDRAKAKRWKNQTAWHLCLFAKNLAGWHNLLRISSIAFREVEEGGGFYGKACVDFRLLKAYSEGLMCSTACVSSYLSWLILNHDSQSVSAYFRTMRSIFKDDFWLEIMPHDFEDQKTVNHELIKLAQENSIGLLATVDAHFPEKDWEYTQHISKLLGVKMNNREYKEAMEMKLDEDDESSANKKLLSLKHKAEICQPVPNLYLMSEAECMAAFRKADPTLPRSLIQEALDNTHLALRGFKPFILDTSDKLPSVSEKMGDAEKIVWQWIHQGLHRIGKEANEHYIERVWFEWEVLSDKGALDYMALVADVVRWARAEGIRVGSGRGSAAGCLISYLIGITNVDPIPYGLLFERFLNPDRAGMPDIDIDFDPEKRPLVKEYVAKRWGAEHVADVVTYTTFAPKKVLIDVSRCFGLPFTEIRKITDTIDIRPDDDANTLEKLAVVNEDLRSFRDAHQDIWEVCLHLEGTPANSGKHPAGVVITPDPVVEHMPLDRGKKGDLVTSWSDSASFAAISMMGLTKMDFLGLDGLTAHDYALSIIHRNTGKMIDLDTLGPERGPDHVDRKVMKGFQDGETLGIFQFGKPQVAAMLRNMHPTNMNDLTVANALNRPGASALIDEYMKRKLMPPLQIQYPHPDVVPVLRETYGLIIYQEQVMSVARILGGLSHGDADQLRKAMGKLYRIPGDQAKRFMAQWRDPFLKHAVKTMGMDKGLAIEVWRDIESKGSYSFNKSHSACYSIHGYKDMYLKTYHPHAFYAARLSYLPGTLEPRERAAYVSALIREARGRDIEVVPPDVNLSEQLWMERDNKIVFGLARVKGVGDVASKTIMEQRNAVGPFNSLEDFRKRIPSRKCNSRVVEALVEAGAFDWDGKRENLKDSEIASLERERLDMTLSVTSGVEDHTKYIKENCYTPDEIEGLEDGEEVIVAGEILGVMRKKTKNNDPYAIVKLGFEVFEWSCKFWAPSLKAYNDILRAGNAVTISGRKDTWNGWVSINATYAALLEDVAKQEMAIAS